MGRPRKIVEGDTMEGANVEFVPATSDKVKVRVLRDFWPTENEADRVRAGMIKEVSKDELIDGLERGILERYREVS